mgnify:CR=1 FL=1
MRFIFIIPFLAAPAFADCPPPPDIAAAADALIAKAQAAPDEGTARPISGQLWELWATAPDEQAQALLDRGMSARASYNFVEALDAFDRLVDYCPDYAEGYNQRAFVNFLRQDFALALVDLDLAIERSPRHVAAISGKALTLMGLGRDEEAQIALREAVSLNPWISERALLVEPAGEEL